MGLKPLILSLGIVAMTAGISSTSATIANTKATDDHHSNNASDKGTLSNGPLFPAVKDGKYGFIDVHGQFVIPPSFTDAQAFSEGLAAVYVGGESYLKRSMSDGDPYISYEGGKWGYIDRTGALAIPPQFGSAYPFSEGFALVTLAKGSKTPSLDEWLVEARPLNPSRTDKELRAYWRKTYGTPQPAGYIDIHGIFKILPKYNAFFSSRFKNGMAHVKLLADGPDFFGAQDETERTGILKEREKLDKGQWIDTAGREIDEIKALGRVKVSRIIFKQKNAINSYGKAYEVNQYGLKDTQDHTVVQALYDSIGEFYHGGSEKASDVTEVCIASKGEALFPISRQCGLIDLNGNRIAPLEFDDIRTGFSNDVAIFTVGCAKMQFMDLCKPGTGKKGIFSIKERKIIVTPQFEEIRSSEEGLMAVKFEGQWGFIDTAGNVVITPHFPFASHFHDGLAQVGLLDYIDKTGRYIYRGSLGKLTFKPKDSPAPKPTVEKSATASIMGTGFIVSHHGHVLTNHHLVKECTAIRAATEGGKKSLTVVGTDAENDLVVLQLPTHVQHTARFREGRTIRSGDGVIVIGFPLRGSLASEANITIGTVSALAGIGNDTRFLQITAPVQPGNSGGPLLDYAGQIVGVVVGKLGALSLAKATGDIPQNINFAINSTVATAFLDANGVEYETEMFTKKMELTDIGAIVKQFTLPIECVR